MIFCVLSAVFFMGVSSGSSESGGVLPAAFSWSNVNGRNYITPAKDQHKTASGAYTSCGSCSTFAAVAAVEVLQYIHSGSPVVLSEQEVIDCSGPFDGCKGPDPLTALDYLRRGGTVLSQVNPYQGVKNVCSSWPVRRYKIDAVETIYNKATYAFASKEEQTQRIKRAIYTHGPVVISFRKNINFNHYPRYCACLQGDMNCCPGTSFNGRCCRGAAFYRYSNDIWRHVGKPDVGHAVMLFGYDDNGGQDGFFLGKNSEGNRSGVAVDGSSRVGENGGFFKMSYAEVRGSDDPDGAINEVYAPSLNSARP